MKDDIFRLLFLFFYENKILIDDETINDLVDFLFEHKKYIIQKIGECND